jgi:hypothetical protein
VELVLPIKPDFPDVPIVFDGMTLIFSGKRNPVFIFGPRPSGDTGRADGSVEKLPGIRVIAIQFHDGLFFEPGNPVRHLDRIWIRVSALARALENHAIVDLVIFIFPAGKLLFSSSNSQNVAQTNIFPNGPSFSNVF